MKTTHFFSRFGIRRILCVSLTAAFLVIGISDSISAQNVPPPPPPVGMPGPNMPPPPPPPPITPRKMKKKMHKKRPPVRRPVLRPGVPGPQPR